MGFLQNDGNTLTYEESIKYQTQLKKDGVVQFLNIYKKFRDHQYKDSIKQINDNILPIRWGDEVEGHIVYLDEKAQIPRLVIDTDYIFDKIQQESEEDQEEITFKIMPEYGSWMIETVPVHPYFTINNFCAVTTNLSDRTKKLQEYLKPGQKVLLTATFPILGQTDQEYFLLPENKGEQVNTVTKSLFIDDRIINKHPRFPTLSQNIRSRRQEKVSIKVPLFKDKNTNLEVSQYNPDPNFIYMDAMAFGMGSSCIQTTFSAKNFSHARRMYDQMAILSPLFLSLTASSPIFRGKLAAIDTRWDIIAASVDCRTPEERDINSQKYIPKSRYDSISYFISDEARNLPQYNDLSFPLNKEIMEYARQKNKEMGLDLDENYITHLGFLFLRDPLVLFERKLQVDNDKEIIHFENIQSTNWNSVRLKPPPALDSYIGWRFEFRTMESQITNDENAAFMILSHIFVRLFYQSDKLNFYIPISLVDENFKRAKQMNSVLNQKYYFRTNIFDDGEPKIEELTLNEIMFGKLNTFEGLFKVSSSIWDQMMEELYGTVEKIEFEKVWEYIRQLTTGVRKTTATWIRNYVQSHPDYKQDSNITNKIAYDLIDKVTQITDGKIQDPNYPPIF